MGRLALLHRGRAKILPPPGLLEPFIERTPNHHYWLGEFFDDNLDRSAEFIWAPVAEAKTKFMVPRLLWQFANPGVETKLLENTCGLFTCINPGHWRRRNAVIVIPARIVLPGSVEAMPVSHADQWVVVHIQRNDAESTVCGTSVVHLHGLKKNAPITCDDCIAAWVRTEQPFMEVK